jgi:hypothetical protein
MRNDERQRPYKQLAQQLEQLAWPRAITLTCNSSS